MDIFDFKMLECMAVTEADLLEILERDDLTKAERSKWRTELKRIREELRRGHEREQERLQRKREDRRDGGWAVEKKRRGRAGRLRPFK
jgi:transcription initiation factor IIE alpha subunit